MGKVYLSLDTLHKLYGISPAVITAIKKKRRKRRNKKDKINNGNMGSTKSSSSHMQGSSHSLVMEALNKDKMDKHIQAINDENKAIVEKLRIKAPPVIQAQQQPLLISGIPVDTEKLKNDIKNGLVSATHKGNKITITDTRLNAKPGPKVGSKRYDTNKAYMSPGIKKTSYVNKKDNIGINTHYNGSDAFQQPNSYKSTLTNTSGNSLTRNEALPVFRFEDGTGNIQVGTSSEKFINENPPTEFEKTPPDTSVQDAIDAKILQDAKDLKDEEDAKIKEAQDLQDAKDAQDLQDAKDAQDLQDAKDVQDAQDAKDAHDAIIKEKARYDKYLIKDLDAISKTSKQKYPKEVKTKEEKYNFLKSLNLIPE